MAKKNNSTGINIVEIDLSSNDTLRHDIKTVPVVTKSTFTTVSSNNNNNKTDFIQLENSNYLLQEDGSKLKL